VVFFRCSNWRVATKRVSKGKITCRPTQRAQMKWEVKGATKRN
jgi:hypothetical protein